LIVAITIFTMVKSINKFYSPAAASPLPGPTNDQQLLTEIRDLLKE